MSKVETVTYNCPECSWTINTPFGKEDLQDHITLHNTRHHDSKISKMLTKSDMLNKLVESKPLKK